MYPVYIDACKHKNVTAPSYLTDMIMIMMMTMMMMNEVNFP